MANPVREIAGLFLKLGVIGFGGPAAHIALMETEVVERRGWMTREHFLDLIGATNLIPGPNSTEMAIHVGYHRGGLLGLITAGVCFILPAVGITVGFAWAYQEYGSLPNVQPLLLGIKPAVLAIIFTAGWRLGKKAFHSAELFVVGLAVAIGSLLGGDEIALLLAGGIVGMFWRRRVLNRQAGKKLGIVAAFALLGRATAARAAWPMIFAASAVGAAKASVPLWKLGLLFLKVGAVLYGGGYVLIAYLRGAIEPGGALVGVLSETELLDAIAVGQFTPGPILSTAAFVGYLVAGLPGAGVASLGIFLPSFLFVAVLNPVVPRLRKSQWTSAFLDAVSAASIGLLAAASLWLLAKTLVDSQTGHVIWPGVLVCGLSLSLIIRWKAPTAVVVLFGAIAGLAISRVL
jgi:chromate transporter